MSDSTSDMFTAIKNASVVFKETVVVPYSKFKIEILKLLQKEGYIKEAVKRGKKTRKIIEIKLLYKDNSPVINGVKRISKPSCRVYGGLKNLQALRSGRGIIILSTPKGIMSGKNAFKEKTGGEVIARIW